MSRKVKYANTHAAIFVPGLGHVKNTLTAAATGTSPAYDMHLGESGLHVKCKGHEFLIPFANIIVMDLFPEEEPQKAAKAK